MSRRLVACVAFVALFPIPMGLAVGAVFANTPAVYETVDAVEVAGGVITVTGITVGHSTPTTLVYEVDGDSCGGRSVEAAARCDRLALLAMSKPGKFQFATTFFLDNASCHFACKLIARTP